MRRLILLLPACAVLWTTGCRVHQSYNPPPVPQTPVKFKELAENDQWKFANPQDGVIRGNWWEMFGDATLNELEAKVSENNQSVKQAEAQYRAARALVRYNRANYFPTIGTSPGVTVSRAGSGRSGATGGGSVGAGGSSSGVNRFYSLPIDATWEPDFWGRIGLTVANATANAQASAADIENVRLSLQAELAGDYFSLRATDMTIDLLNTTLQAYEKALTLTVNRYNGGVASRADVVQAQAQLESTRAQLTDIRVTRAQLEHAIAMLTGRAPADVTIAEGKINGPPPAIPLGLPSQLLERRPDIAGYERQVAAANAVVGIGKVAFYPSFAISVGTGLAASSFSKFLNGSSLLWSIGPQLTQTLFDFGRRRATLEQYQATYDATIAGYRQAALTAFQEVEDNLAALHYLAREAEEQARAVRASEESVTLELDRYKGGTVSYLDVIQTQVIALNNERTAVSLLERRMTSAVNLVRALGGGWDRTKLPSADEVRKKS